LHKSLSAPKESDITVASVNLQIDEVSDSVIVQSTWPKIFTICSENYQKLHHVKTLPKIKIKISK
jgi:hypothetical protein